MYGKIGIIGKFGCVIAIGALIHHHNSALAGWTGSMNGVGYGTASANVTSSTLNATKATSPYTNGPNATIAPTIGYQYSAPLPVGASSATVARVKGSAGYVWKTYTVGSNGDKTDNDAIEQRVRVPFADCAELEMESTSEIQPEIKSGKLIVNTKATSGTAIWLRAIEYFGEKAEPSTEDLIASLTDSTGSLRFDVLLIGPFDLNTATCNPLTIPFTYETDTNRVYFISDGIAKSNPLLVQCPADMEVTCGDSVTYPLPLVSGCIITNVSYSPAPGYVFPAGVTPVTVTVSDAQGNTASCVFNVNVTGLEFHGFYSPIGGTGGSCTDPLRTAKLGNNIPVKFDVSCGGSSYLLGTPTMKISKCGGGTVGGGNFVMVGNEWHFNWDTSGLTAGVYELTATLQDNTLKSVWIRLR